MIPDDQVDQVGKHGGKRPGAGGKLKYKAPGPDHIEDTGKPKDPKGTEISTAPDTVLDPVTDFETRAREFEATLKEAVTGKTVPQEIIDRHLRTIMQIRGGRQAVEVAAVPVTLVPEEKLAEPVKPEALQETAPEALQEVSPAIVRPDCFPHMFLATDELCQGCAQTKDCEQAHAEQVKAESAPVKEDVKKAIPQGAPDCFRKDYNSSKYKCRKCEFSGDCSHA